MMKKHKKVYKILSYTDHLLIFACIVTGCFFISAFASVVSISVGIASSAVGTKICAITAVIKKYQSRIKKIKKDKYKILLLEKNKLNSVEVLLSKTLFESNISYVSLNNLIWI